MIRAVFFISFIAYSSTALAWEFKDFKEELGLPFKDSQKVSIYGGAATLTVLLFEDQIGDPVEAEAVRTRPLGNWTGFGNFVGLGFPNVMYVVGQGVAGLAGNEKGYERSIGMLKATLYSNSITQVLKVTVREQRPNDKHQRDSFPSGHSTMAFAFGGYVFEEHGWKWGVPALAMSLFSGASRINDNKHHLHDVFAGATIGLAYGIGMSKLNKKKNGLSFMIVPIVDAQSKGIALMKDF
jgi:membrane-associated phospholipid phosphatase